MLVCEKGYAIYLLIDPQDALIKYVGISSDVQRRFHQHISCYGNNVEKNAWIQSLKENSLLPILRIIETKLTHKDAQKKEMQLIQQYLESGMPLTNKDGVHKKYACRGMMGARKKKKEITIHPTVQTQEQSEQFFTPKEVALVFRTQEETVKRLLRQKQLPGYKISGQWRISQSDLSAYLTKQKNIQK